MPERDEVLEAIVALLSPGVKGLITDVSAAPALSRWVQSRWNLTESAAAELTWSLVERVVTDPPLDTGRTRSLQAARCLLAIYSDQLIDADGRILDTGVAFAEACRAVKADYQDGETFDPASVTHRQALAVAVAAPKWPNREDWTKKRNKALPWVAAAVYAEFERLLDDDVTRQDLVKPWHIATPQPHFGQDDPRDTAVPGMNPIALTDAETRLVSDTPIGTAGFASSVPGIGELVALYHHDGFPRAADTDPYTLGATESEYGDQRNHGVNDPYVARTHHNFDDRLATSITANDFTLVVGPSKAGKTRSAFEAIARALPASHIVFPRPGRLSALVTHPLVADSKLSLLVWLDDLGQFVSSPDPLTLELLEALLSRPGTTRVLGTLQTEQRAILLGDESTVVGGGELQRGGTWSFSARCHDDSHDIHSWSFEADRRCTQPTNADIVRTRQLLRRAVSVQLDHTTADPAEQRAAAAAYPGEDLRFGLGAQLACAPELLRIYRDAEHAPQPRLHLHAVVRAAIDWTRCGRPDPMPEDVLVSAAQKELQLLRRDVNATADATLAAIEQARTPWTGNGKAVMLISHILDDGTRGYEAAPYLVSADDSEGTRRRIADGRWDDALQSADAAKAYLVMRTAHRRGLVQTALRVGGRASDLGSADAMCLVGYLYETEFPQPDVETALHWYRLGANAGCMTAQLNAARILSRSKDGAAIADADRFYSAAAETGDASAMHAYADFLLLQATLPGHDKAVSLLTESAKDGDVHAMIHLGNILSNGEKQDIELAEYWLREAAEKKTTAAYVALGYFLVHYKPLSALNEAERLLGEAAEQDNVHALVGLADIAANHSKKPDLKLAANLYRRAAETGDPHAMHIYGVFLINRRKSARDGYDWLRRAADKGDSRAKFDLAKHLIEQSESDDQSAGFHYLLDAAESGNVFAMCKLGTLYKEDHPAIPGQPAEPAKPGWRRWFKKAQEENNNPKLAAMWFTRAAERGHTHAMCELGQLYLNRYDPPALRDARRWYERAADVGDASAMYAVGYIIEFKWKPQNAMLAAEWYMRAAEAGNSDAAFRLATLSRPVNPQRSRDWLEQAVDSGLGGALRDLVDVLLVDLDDPEHALTWCLKAAKKNDVWAMRAAAHIFKDRIYPPRLKEARRWLKTAAERGDADAMWELADLLEHIRPPQPNEARQWRIKAEKYGGG